MRPATPLPVLFEEAVLAELAPSGADLPMPVDDDAASRWVSLLATRQTTFFERENPAEGDYAAQLARHRSV